MFAIATLICRAEGTCAFHNGILHPLPAELRDNNRLGKYQSINSPGWGVDEFGYRHYCAFLPNGGRLIFPALELLGEARARRKFPDFAPKFTKAQIEALASAYVKEMVEQENALSERVNMLVHDLRALSVAIYHSALEANRLIESEDYREAAKRIDSVIASQSMLKMRTDALDFEGNRLDPDATKVSIFRKCDKVARCFKARAISQRKTVSFGGNSFRESYGPDIFELVPYALIDNAIKYAPEGGAVDVTVNDASGTRLTVTSFGPKLKRTELESIFQRGVRAEAAKTTGLPGSGLGLAMAMRIVSMFKGTIHCQQSSASVVFNDQEYFETTFTVDVPAA